MSDVTQILQQIDSGDPSAADQLLPLVYDELRKLAAARLQKESSGQTWQATALVHEAYVRLVDTDRPQHWNGRHHFFAAAAEAMRRLLIESARRRQSAKRGGELRRINLEAEQLVAEEHDELLLLDEALEQLERLWPRQAQIVKLRYFAGLTNSQACEVVGVSPATGERYWTFARAWLYAALKQVGFRDDDAKFSENSSD